MKRTKVVDALQQTTFDVDICVKGWVRTHRSGKAVEFIALNDGSTIKNIQIVVDPSKFDADLLKQITTALASVPRVRWWQVRAPVRPARYRPPTL